MRDLLRDHHTIHLLNQKRDILFESYEILQGQVSEKVVQKQMISRVWSSD